MINIVNQYLILCHQLILHYHYINIHNLSPILHNLDLLCCLLFCIIAIYTIITISYISYNHTQKSLNKTFRCCVNELYLYTVNMRKLVYMYYLHVLYVFASLTKPSPIVAIWILPSYISNKGLAAYCELHGIYYMVTLQQYFRIHREQSCSLYLLPLLIS